MKQKSIILLFLFVMVLFIPYHLQAQETEIFRQDGIASWYGKEFDGRPTASGEIFDSSQLTAAHPSLPFGTMLVVTNRQNNKKVTVRVNDRGPFVAARIIDVSRAAAEQLDIIVTGTAPVSIESADQFALNKPIVEPARVSKPVQETVPQETVPKETLPQKTVQLVPPAAPVVSQPQVYAPVTETTAAAPAVNAAPGNTVPVVSANTAPSAVTYTPVKENIYATPPAVIQVPYQVKLTPEINVAQNKSYRLQIGSYKVARNAVDAFERLKTAGLNPAYERFTDGANIEYFRVVIAGVRGTDVKSTAEKIGTAGFREAVIREEN